MEINFGRDDVEYREPPLSACASRKLSAGATASIFVSFRRSQNFLAFIAPSLLALVPHLFHAKLANFTDFHGGIATLELANSNIGI